MFTHYTFAHTQPTQLVHCLQAQGPHLSSPGRMEVYNKVSQITGCHVITLQVAVCAAASNGCHACPKDANYFK